MNNKRTLQSMSPDQLENTNNKKHLSSQNMSTNSGDVFSWDRLSNLMDEKLEDVARKPDLAEIQSQIEELREENKQLKANIKTLATRLEQIDRKSRSSSIVVGGLKSSDNQTAKSEILKLCSEVLHVQVNVVSTRMLPKSNSFLFNLETSLQVNNIMAAKNKLRGMSIYIQNDYTANEQTVRYNLRKISRSITKQNSKIRVRLGEFCLYIDNKKYSWSDGKIIAYSSEDSEYLGTLLAQCKYDAEIETRSLSTTHTKTAQ